MKDLHARWFLAALLAMACADPRDDAPLASGSGGAGAATDAGVEAQSPPGSVDVGAPPGTGGVPAPVGTGGAAGTALGGAPGTGTGGLPGGGAGGVDGGPSPDVPTLPPVPNQICEPSRVLCKSDTELDTCSADGSKLTTTKCAAPTAYCYRDRCVSCLKAEHCPAPPACRSRGCAIAEGNCVTLPAPGLACEGTGTCSAAGFCRKPVSLGTFLIDATEVTKAQYQAFVAAKGTDTSGQAADRSFNTTFTPTNEWPPATDQQGLPVNWVDWCDAVAYCKWAGKRLCGRIGGGSTPHDDYAKAAVSQWHAACTDNGTKRFPYGNTYDPSKCVGDKSPTGGYSGKAQVVASFPGCEGGFPGIFDLSGNLVEWEDSCVAYAGATNLCRERGNSFQGPDDLAGQPGYFAACDMNNNNPRNSTNNTRGFRCCQDN